MSNTFPAIDAFALLTHVGGEPGSYAGIGVAMSKAALAVAGALLKSSDLATLVHARQGIGDDLDAVVGAMKPKDAASVVRRLDPAAPPVAEHAARDRLVALLGGAPTTPAVTVRDVKGVDGLREARARLDGSFAHWLGSLNPSALNTLLRAVDPHLPNVRATRDEEARRHVTAIAEGGEPSPAFDVASMDLANLRAARDTFGDALKGRLDAVPARPRKALLKALDPHMQGLRELPDWSVTPRLLALAGGAEPARDYDIARMDADGLRSAQAEMGAGFRAWLDSRKAKDRKDALLRIDQHRPDAKKAKPVEILIYLERIAKGGPVFAPEGAVQDVG